MTTTYFVTVKKGDLRRDYHVPTHAHSLLLYDHIRHHYPDWTPAHACLSEADPETLRHLNVWTTSPYDLCAKDFERFANGETVIAQGVLTEQPTEREALAERCFVALVQSGGWQSERMPDQAFYLAHLFIAKRKEERSK